MELLFNSKFIQKMKNRHNIVDITFEVLTTEFLVFKRPRIKESSYYRYVTDIQRHILPYLGKYRLKELENFDFNQLAIKLEELNLSDHYIRDIMVILKGILKFGERRHGNNFNLSLINLPKYICKRPKLFTIHEQNKLLKYCMQSDDLRDIAIALTLLSGLRIGEICALHWKDIDLEQKLIYVNGTLQRIGIENHKTKIIQSTPKTKTSLREVPMVIVLFNKLKRI